MYFCHQGTRYCVTKVSWHREAIFITSFLIVSTSPSRVSEGSGIIMEIERMTIQIHIKNNVQILH